MYISAQGCAVTKVKCMGIMHITTIMLCMLYTLMVFWNPPKLTIHYSASVYKNNWDKAEQMLPQVVEASVKWGASINCLCMLYNILAKNQQWSHIINRRPLWLLMALICRKDFKNYMVTTCQSTLRWVSTCICK